MDTNLRPSGFSEFVGQSMVTSVLKVAVHAAKLRGEAMGHVLLCGPSGTGKTTLAQILGREMGVNVKSASALKMSEKGDLIPILRSLGPRGILFLDEIHCLPVALQEFLYAPLEDRKIDLLFGKHLRSIPLQPFTLVGATTLPGHLTAPFKNRFLHTLPLGLYEPAELGQIVRRNAALLGVAIDYDASEAIAQRSRGTPRLANHLLYQVRDLMTVRGTSRITVDLVKASCALAGIDGNGLTSGERKLLSIVAGSGTIGLDSLSSALNESPSNVEADYEPYLVQAGFLSRTPRGRMVLPLGRAALAQHTF